MMRAFALSTMLLMTAAGAYAGDADRGELVFHQCSGCHSATPGINRSGGPNLFGVIGREAGTVSHFHFSPAMRKAGTWTPERLKAFIMAPDDTVPGTTMDFAGLRDAAQVDDLLAYLGTLQ